METTYYKVVDRLANGARVSCFAPKELGLRKTYHANGKALVVDNGMVFSNFDDASWFAYRWKARNDSEKKSGYIVNPEVWECTVEYMTEPPKLVLNDIRKVKIHLISKLLTGFAQAFRSKTNNLKNWQTYITRHYRWPAGTKFACGIKLTKKVED